MQPQVADGTRWSATAVWIAGPRRAPFQLYVESATRTAGGAWSAPVRISPVDYQATESPRWRSAADGTATAVGSTTARPGSSSPRPAAPDERSERTRARSASFDNPLAPDARRDDVQPARPRPCGRAHVLRSSVTAAVTSVAADGAWSYPAAATSERPAPRPIEPDVATDASGHGDEPRAAVEPSTDATTARSLSCAGSAVGRRAGRVSGSRDVSRPGQGWTDRSTSPRVAVNAANVPRLAPAGGSTTGPAPLVVQIPIGTEDSGHVAAAPAGESSSATASRPMPPGGSFTPAPSTWPGRSPGRCRSRAPGRPDSRRRTPSHPPTRGRPCSRRSGPSVTAPRRPARA